MNLIDPLAKDYPWYTPYQFAGNKPIQFIEYRRKEEGWPEIYNRARQAGAAAIKMYNNVQTAAKVAEKALDLCKNTEVQAYIHLEGKYKIGARFAGEIKKNMGLDVDLGSIELLSVSADYNFQTQKWSGEVNYLAKDGKVVGSQGVSFSAPVCAALGVPVGVGASMQENYVFDKKSHKVNTTTTIDAGASFGPVNVTNSYEASTNREDEEKTTMFKGSVGTGGAAGIIVTGEYKVEAGVKVVNTSNTDD